MRRAQTSSRRIGAARGARPRARRAEGAGVRPPHRRDRRRRLPRARRPAAPGGRGRAAGARAGTALRSEVTLRAAGSPARARRRRTGHAADACAVREPDPQPDGPCRRSSRRAAAKSSVMGRITLALVVALVCRHARARRRHRRGSTQIDTKIASLQDRLAAQKRARAGAARRGRRRHQRGSGRSRPGSATSRSA